MSRQTRDFRKEEYSVRAEQTVSEMVVEALARQAEALSEGTERPFDDAFAEVLKTPAGRRLSELADGPHRHEKAAQWQAGLLADREARRPAYLRELGDAETRYLWLGSFMGLAEDMDRSEEYYAFLRKRFASL
jgi:hypothetical protein